MLQNNSKLKSLIDKLWNQFWAGGISNPLTAIEQITYLIFIRKIDKIDQKFASLFEGDFLPEGKENKPENRILKSECRWSYIKELKAEEMLLQFQTKVFPFLKQLSDEASSFTKHMRNAVFIIPSPSLIFEAVTTIEEIFIEIERDAVESGHTFQDIQGDVYEYLLSEIATAGKMGQFRTPRHIIKLLCELVSPKYGDQILDPACGTGGFLLGAYQYILTSLDKNVVNKADEDGFIRSSASVFLHEKEIKFLNNSLQGYDIDVTMVRLGLMNLIMHSIENPKIDYQDTMSKSFSDNTKYDVILANPPFKGSINKNEIDPSFQLKTPKTELLFIERIYTMLNDGGIAGVIVPQGVLTGTANAFIEARKIMVEKCELKAVITMPSGVFKPYAGVATAILIFTKAGETRNVWFYNMKNDGYSLDDKRTKIPESDLQEIIRLYKGYIEENEDDRTANHFLVSREEIEVNEFDLSFNRYNVEIFPETKYETPVVLLKKLEDIEKEISKELASLKVMI